MKEAKRSDEMRKILINRLENNHFANEIDIKIELIQYQKSRVSLKVSEKHLNPNGTIHGGVLMTLADNAAGTCVSYTGQPTPTLDLSYRFLKPVFAGDKVTADAQVIQAGKTIIVVETNLHVAEKLVGTSTASFFRSDRNLPELPPETMDLADKFIKDYINKKSE